MAAERTKRSNAGNKMEKLIGEALEKEEDEFWKEHADFFGSDSSSEDSNEEEENDFVDQAEDSEDSDIDRDEDDESSDDGENEKEVNRRMRKSGARTGAYVDPALKRKRHHSSSARREKRATNDLAPGESIADRKQKRASTAAGDEARKLREAEESKRLRPQRKPQEAVRKLTQTEVLMEAARTELINKASLERLMKLEDEMKKENTKRKQLTGPRVRYHSRTVMKEAPPAAAAISAARVTKKQNQPRYERVTVNIITLTDVKDVQLGVKEKKRPDAPALCVITGKPAKYRDPKTGHPYASIEAFKEIRRKDAAGEKIQPLKIMTKPPPTLKPISKLAKPAAKSRGPNKPRPPVKLPPKPTIGKTKPGASGRAPSKASPGGSISKAAMAAMAKAGLPRPGPSAQQKASQQAARAKAAKANQMGRAQPKAKPGASYRPPASGKKR